MTTPDLVTALPVERVQEMLVEAGFFSFIDENGRIHASAVDPKTPGFFSAKFPTEVIALRTSENKYLLTAGAIHFLANAMKKAGDE